MAISSRVSATTNAMTANVREVLNVSIRDYSILIQPIVPACCRYRRRLQSKERTRRRECGEWGMLRFRMSSDFAPVKQMALLTHSQGWAFLATPKRPQPSNGPKIGVVTLIWIKWSPWLNLSAVHGYNHPMRSPLRKKDISDHVCLVSRERDPWRSAIEMPPRLKTAGLRRT